MTDIQTTATLASAFTDELLGEYTDKVSLCAAFGISTRTLDRLEAGRQGPPKTKIGKRVLYRKAAVREWLASREQTQPRAARRGR